MDWSSGVHHVTFDQVMEMAKGQLITVQCETTEEDEKYEIKRSKEQWLWQYWFQEGYNDQWYGREWAIVLVSGSTTENDEQADRKAAQAYRKGWLRAEDDLKDLDNAREELWT